MQTSKLDRGTSQQTISKQLEPSAILDQLGQAKQPLLDLQTVDVHVQVKVRIGWRCTPPRIKC